MSESFNIDPYYVRASCRVAFPNCTGEVLHSRVTETDGDLGDLPSAAVGLRCWSQGIQRVPASTCAPLAPALAP